MAEGRAAVQKKAADSRSDVRRLPAETPPGALERKVPRHTPRPRQETRLTAGQWVGSKELTVTVELTPFDAHELIQDPLEPPSEGKLGALAH